MKKIGNFFAKIGRGIKKGFLGLISWIKNTAWIQPLLIVGLIFGVFLSIKPFFSWISGVLNPDETYAFCKKNTEQDYLSKFVIDYNKDTITLDGVDGENKTVVLFYNDSTSNNDLQSTLSEFSARYPSVEWKCINLNFDDEDAEKAFYTQDVNEKINILQEYYGKIADTYKIFEGKDLSLFGDSGNSIPSPTFVRFDNGELVGLTGSLDSSNPYYSLEQFVNGNTSTDWQLSLSEYIEANKD